MEEKVVKEIDLDDILPNRFQPRIKFDEESLIQLANSIKEHGVIQPIIVREIGDKYEIIAGERRYKASVLAGKTTIPVIVNNANDMKSTELALIENVQRQDLTPIEEAASYKKILEIGNLTQEQLAEKIDKKQSTVSNKLRLLNLSDAVQEALLNEKISERHARSLLKLTEDEKQQKMLDRIIDERLTVRQTDTEIDKSLGKTSVSPIEEAPKPPAEATISPSQEVTKPSGEEPISPINAAPKMEKEPEKIEIEDEFVTEAEIADKAGYDDQEEHHNPGFLDIDNIEKNARDIITEPPVKDVSELLREDKLSPSEEIANDLAEYGIDVNMNAAEESTASEEGASDLGVYSVNINKPDISKPKVEEPSPSEEVAHDLAEYGVDVRIKRDEEMAPADKIANDLAAQGVDINGQSTPENQNEGPKKFFNFSPGELIESEDEKPVPQAPESEENQAPFANDNAKPDLLASDSGVGSQAEGIPPIAPDNGFDNSVKPAEPTPQELTGFEFKYKADDNELQNVSRNTEIIKERIRSLVEEFKQAGSKVEIEEIDLEGQMQIIIKVNKQR